jgi:hypothetical protein
VSSAFDTLHVLRIRGHAPADGLSELDPLVAEELIIVTERGCVLTADGLARHAELLEQWRIGADLKLLAKSYDRFMAVNKPVKDLCARWQTQAGDQEARFMTAEELAEIVERVRPALRRAGQVAPRFEAYIPRLDAAIDAARAGDDRFVTDPRVDSVHSIWFECHEDYLTSLGRDREEEGSY